MKRILAPILLLTLLFPSLAFGVTMDDLVYRDGIHYKKFSEVPFTGKTTGRKQGSFKNGKAEGPWVSYHDNGQLWSKGTSKNGKQHGPRVSYWENGQLWSKGTYKDGKRHGPWVFYTDNGTKRFTKEKFDDLVIDEGSGTYSNGVKVN
jgi:antitoxin component YwqK of YwqJK toxin-antitoxin module